MCRYGRAWRALNNCPQYHLAGRPSDSTPRLVKKERQQNVLYNFFDEALSFFRQGEEGRGWRTNTFIVYR